MTIQEEIKQLENDISYLYNQFTGAAASRSGSFLNQILIKRNKIKELKEQL